MPIYPSTINGFPEALNGFPETLNGFPETLNGFPEGFTLPTTIGTIAAANGFAPDWNIRADYGYVLGPGGGVASIQDLSGNGKHFAEAVDAQQPLWLPTDANGFPAFQGDGVDDRLTNTHARSAIVSGTAATHMWWVLVAAQDTWTANDTLISDGTATCFQNTTAGGMRLFGTAQGGQNNNLIGYKRIVINFTGSGTSYLQIGASLTQGTNIGAPGAAANVCLLAALGGVRYFNGRIAEAASGRGDISPAAIAAIDAYCSARYGASVLT